MELRDKCFHSIRSFRFDSEFEERVRSDELKDILMKMEMIFKSGFILPYGEIIKLYGEVSRNRYVRFNGDDMVSIYIEPKYSIISVGKNNRYGHPNDNVLENLEESKIYRINQDGSIMFKLGNNKLEIQTCAP